MNNQHPEITEILKLDRIDNNIFLGPIIPSSFTRTFGGQVAAQALVAALETVDKSYGLHSLHGYFVGPGDATKHTVFLVEQIRDGRSFLSRHIQAVQDGQQIFSMQCSFHRRDDTGIEHSDQMRTVPDPETIQVNHEELPPSSRALLEEWAEWDIRQVPAGSYERNPYTQGQQLVWFKTKKRLPDEESFHLCTLTYMSDMTLLHTALVPHKGRPVQMASLDHAIWFLRPFRADEWLLYDQLSPSAHAGRALTHGRVFNRQGDLVAIVTQEGLTRNLKAGQRALPLKNLESGQQ
jgi:hypothetical protein